MKNFLITHPFYKKILLAAIWLILVCGIVIVLKKEISPVIAIDSLTVSYPDTTLEILPGATMEEDIAWDRSTLESIDLAFSYTDDVWQDTQVKVSVFRDDAVIMEPGPEPDLSAGGPLCKLLSRSDTLRRKHLYCPRRESVRRPFLDIPYVMHR